MALFLVQIDLKACVMQVYFYLIGKFSILRVKEKNMPMEIGHVK